MDVIVDKSAYAPGSKIPPQTWWAQVMEEDLLLNADNENLFFVMGRWLQPTLCMHVCHFFFCFDVSLQEF